MRSRRLVSLACVAAIAGRASADERLTLDEALRLARERAPSIVAARAAVEEAQARVRAASYLLPNPQLELAAGPRRSPGSTTTDTEIAVQQPLDLFGRRGARVGVAKAGVDRALAEADEAVRQVLREVAAAFGDAAAAEERRQIAAASAALAQQLRDIAVRRHDAGDVAILDVNAAQAAMAGAEAEGLAAGAQRDAALQRLRGLLGADVALPAPPDASVPPVPLDALMSRLEERPDLRALAAELRVAEAEARLAAAEAGFDLGVGVSHAREEESDVLLGHVVVTLPLFNRPSRARGEADARAARLRLQLAAARQVAEAELRAVHAEAAGRRAAVQALAERAIPLLARNEELARRSYEEGEIGLAEVLALRRETLEMRRQYVEQLEELVSAVADVRIAAGGRP